MGKKQKSKNAGIGVDFKRVKHKVGKKLPRARNETNVDFTSRTINLPNQAVREDRSGAAVNYQNLNLKELLSQTTHHNDKARKHSLVGLADLFSRHPDQLKLQAAQVLTALAERVVDGEEGVRSSLRTLLNGSVLPVLGPNAVRPFMPIIMAHLCGAMTHLSLEIRNDALLFLDILMEHAPLLVVEGHMAPCLAHFCDLLSLSHRGRNIKAQSLKSLTKVLTALCSFLGRAFPEARQQQGRTDPAGAAAAGSTAAAEVEAGPGLGPGSEAMQWCGVLGAGRCRWPQRTAHALQASLERLLQQAAATGRPRGRARGGQQAHARKAAAGKPGVAMEGSGPSGGDKPAAQQSPHKIPAAGGAAQPSSTIAQELAAASDAHACAARLLSLLMDCFLECAPSQLATAPELEQASALAMIATASNIILQQLLLPAGQAAAGAGEGGDGARGVLQQLHPVVVRRMAPFFPATVPAVKPAAPMWDALVRYNLQCARLFAAFLPLAGAPQPPAAGEAMVGVEANMAAQAAAGGGSCHDGWVDAVVSYYVLALEQGVLVPAAQGTLSDAAAASAVQALPPGASDDALAAVAVGVRCLDPPTAQRLMAAVGTYAGRQAPRSAARLACITMQHKLLRSALAGSMYLEDSVVAGWLAPLPKLLWDLGPAAPESTTAALRLMLDAARYAPPGAPIVEHCVGMQPQLVPLYAAQLPAKAAKAALAQHAAAAAAAASQGTPSAGGGARRPVDPSAVLVLLPGVVSKLPHHVAQLAIDVLYHVGPLCPQLLRPLAAAVCTRAMTWPLAHRLLEVLMRRLESSQDPSLAASLLLTLLFGPQHGQLALTPEGTDITAGLAWQLALTDSIVAGLPRLGGAAALLQVLAPQLAQLPLADAATAGAAAARLQRYSFVRLSTAAAAEPGAAAVTTQPPTHGSLDKLQPALAALLPRAAALSAIELLAAADTELQQPGGCAPYGQHPQPPAPAAALLALLDECPSLAVAVLQQLNELLQGFVAGASAATGSSGSSLTPAVAVGAALRGSQAVIKAAACRTALLREQEAVMAAMRSAAAAAADALLPAAGGETDAAVAAAAAGAGAGCGYDVVHEAQRLEQMVADLFGLPAGSW